VRIAATYGRWARLALFGALSGFALTAQAHADPCEAISEDGPTPRGLGFGATFSGPITHVIDGDSLCVAVGPGPENLVEVRLADFYAPEFTAKGGPSAIAALETVALGRDASCVANLRTYDRIAARCTIGGRPIGDLMRQAGVTEGGNGLATSFSPQRFSAPVAAAGGAFRNCAAARAAGAAPVRRGQPGYGAHLDRDGDGVGCEPYRPR